MTSDHTHACDRLTVERLPDSHESANYALYDRGGNRLVGLVGWLSIGTGEKRGVPFAFDSEATAEFGGTCRKRIEYANSGVEEDDVVRAAGARLYFESE